MSLPKIPQEYLEQIDCLQPDSSLESILEFEPLQRWAAQSDSHRKAVELAVEKSRRWDQQIQDMMPDVVVPADLERRLVIATSGVASEPPAKVELAKPSPVERRRVAIAVYGASLAMLLMIVLGIGGLTNLFDRKPAITEADIQRNTSNWMEQLHQCVFRPERPQELHGYPNCPDINPELKWDGFSKVSTEFGPALGSYVGLGETSNGTPRDCFLLTFRNAKNYDLRQINVSMPPTPKIGFKGNQLFAASQKQGYVHVLLFSNHEDYPQLVKPKVILTTAQPFQNTYVAFANPKQLQELKKRLAAQKSAR